MDEPSPRILFVSYTANCTGPTNSLLLLLKHLRYRYKVSVLLPDKGLFSERLAREGVPFFSLPNLTKWSIPTMIRLIRQEHFDLVYGNNSSSRNAFVAAKLARVPFISHIREIGWDWSWQTMGYLRFAQAVVAVSQACAASIAPFVRQDRLHVVYNGVQITADPVDHQAARARLLGEIGLTPEDVVIISVAHICPRKGQTYAIEAMAKIVARTPNARLLLVGGLDRDATYVGRTRALIREMNLEHHVFLLGFRQDVIQLLQGADIFLHTAIVDPHPRSVIEAMAADLSVGAFAADGVAETVIDGQTGYLVPKGDVSALADVTLRLVKDKSLRVRFGRNGRRRVRECFSAQGAAQRVGVIIDAILEAAKR